MTNEPRGQGRYFTDATRLAGLEARRRKALKPSLTGRPEVFVVHLPAASATFGWEIRRFGSVVLQQGLDQFDTIASARAAGETALATA